MNRVLSIFLLASISILPTKVEGQFRGARGGFGHGRPAGPGVRPQVPMRLSPNVTPGGIPTGPLFPVVRPGMPIVRSPFVGGRHFNRQIIFGQQFPFYSPFFSSVPFYGSPFYSAPFYGAPAYTQPADTAPQPPAASQNELDLSYQLGRLTEEVEQ